MLFTAVGRSTCLTARPRDRCSLPMMGLPCLLVSVIVSIDGGGADRVVLRSTIRLGVVLSGFKPSQSEGVWRSGDSFLQLQLRATSVSSHVP